MFDSGNLSSATGATRADGEIGAIHSSCGVFTTPTLVSDILDQMGWVTGECLSTRTLLEPCAGEGAFVVEAGVRLIDSCREAGLRVDRHRLSSVIRAVEFHEPALKRARANVVAALLSRRVSPTLAAMLAEDWVVQADFLTMALDRGTFTDVAGNPPYLRWSKIPVGLKSLYESTLPEEFARGDLFVPFLDRMLGALSDGGRIGVVCSDRWRYMGFAEAFREKWIPLLDIRTDESVENESAFGARVGTQARILVAEKRARRKKAPKVSGKTLGELGYRFRSGPALGHSPAFQVSLDAALEKTRLLSYAVAKDVTEGVVANPSSAVISVHEEDGRLVTLKDYPKLERHLARHRAALKARYVVETAGRAWYTTIDRVRASDWSEPKLLIPEISRIPRIALDDMGTIPSHGVYAIFHPTRGRLDELYERLRDGGLLGLIEDIAPRVNGGYFRCYGKVLERIRL